MTGLTFLPRLLVFIPIAEWVRIAVIVLIALARVAQLARSAGGNDRS